jgi:signal transduction histidine kinase
MESLLEDLLTFSRAGRQRHMPEDVDVSILIQNIVEMVGLPPGFMVNTTIPLPLLKTESTPLETVFRNLIGNAIKHHHAPAEGWVEVSAQDQGDLVEFTVRDNGPGIQPEFHDRVFEMFQTLRSRDQVEGSGIGLALVKKHIESRGGNIQLESKVGEGATFRFTWPKGI